MAVIFGGNVTDSLASLRYKSLGKKVINAKSFISPEQLPPTESATMYHSQRVYYQMMVWTGMAKEMNPVDWGWKLEDNEYVPTMTDKAAAPENLLNMVHCNCKTSCRTQRCSCRRYGLPCMPACGSCQLENCDNPNNQALDEEESDDETYFF